MIIEPVDKYLTNENLRLFTHITTLLPEAIIAGGAARQIFLGEKLGSTDIDLYFPNSISYEGAALYFLNNRFKRYHRSDNAEGFYIEYEGQNKAQLIRKTFTANPQEIFDSFDLTCCMFAIKNDEIYYTEQAAEHAQKKLMVFVNPDKSTNRYRRMGKYLKKGYAPSCPISQDILGEFLQYLEEYEVPDPTKENPRSLFITHYKRATLRDIQDNIEYLFGCFFGYSLEDY